MYTSTFNVINVCYKGAQLLGLNIISWFDCWPSEVLLQLKQSISMLRGGIDRQSNLTACAGG